MSMLELKNIDKRYESPEGGPSLDVLKNLDLTIDEGDFIAITGPSGCGKSTLMNVIGTLDDPDAGQLFFENRDLTAMNDREKAAFRNTEIGFVFQLHHLLPQCTVLENVLMPALPAGNGNDPATIHRAKELLKRTGLQDRMTYLPGLLSGGERQRVAVVRSLVNSPKLLLADEPTGSLDRESADALAELLCELRKSEGLTMILVTHSAELASLAETTYVLKNHTLTIRNED